MATLFGETPLMGEMMWFSFNYAPKGWAQCNGQLLPINQNQALFALLGTTYGGNGTTNFALPDLRGRAAMGVGNGHTQGERAGSATQALSAQQIPPHTHQLTFKPPANKTAANSNSPTGNYPAPGGSYGTSGNTNMGVTATNTQTAVAGGSQPFSVMQPYLVLNCCMALSGAFPSRT
ncbi:phage tail protein [Fibrella aquatilis]|nr:tail fiber protein [Fibrella aquatilis]